MTFDEAMSRAAQDYLFRTVEACNGNVKNAAREAGRNRTDFYKLLARFRIQIQRPPPEPRFAEISGAIRRWPTFHSHSVIPQLKPLTVQVKKK